MYLAILFAFLCVCVRPNNGNASTITVEPTPPNHTPEPKAPCFKEEKKCECKTELTMLKQEIEKIRQSLKPVELDIFLRSEGCDDPGIPPCGHAYIQINGKEYSLKRRGHNVVVLNHDGSVWKTAAFDTYGDPLSGKSMNTFLLNVPYGRIVLVAVQDAANNHYKDAHQGLQEIGADTSKVIGFRDSWLLIGYKGERKSWVYQASSPRYKGPTEIRRVIPVPRP